MARLARTATRIAWALLLVGVPGAALPVVEGDDATLSPWHGGMVVRHDAGLADDVAGIATRHGATTHAVPTDGTWTALRFAHDGIAETLAEALEQVPGVLSVFPDFEVQVALGEAPADPMYGQQWGWPAVDAERAWAITTGDPTVRVAVLDTGVDADHEDLVGAFCVEPRDLTVDADPHDRSGHGTHVAGTIAARIGNQVGVVGAAEVCLVVAKVLRANGSGAVSDVVLGIDWAIANRADVISMSFGADLSENPDPVYNSLALGAREFLHFYILKAAASDAVLVAAAGNRGCPGDGSETVLWPARFAEVIAVGASAPPGDAVAPDSSCGRTVDLVAPGQAILSTLPDDAYGMKDGTSMAAPHVSGAAALVRAANPLVPAPLVRCILQATAVDLGAPGHDAHTGWGRLSMGDAVILARLPPQPLADEPTWRDARCLPRTA